MVTLFVISDIPWEFGEEVTIFAGFTALDKAQQALRWWLEADLLRHLDPLQVAMRLSTRRGITEFESIDIAKNLYKVVNVHPIDFTGLE
jgi:hypothetical protein